MANQGIAQEKENFITAKTKGTFDPKKTGKCKIFSDLLKEAQKGLDKQRAKEAIKAKKEAAKSTKVALTCTEKGVVLGEMSNFPLPDI